MKVKSEIVMPILLRWRGAAVTGAPLFERLVCMCIPALSAPIVSYSHLSISDSKYRQHTP